LKEVEVNVRNGRISWLISCFWKIQTWISCWIFFEF
jgi:hypothetical protein